MLLLNLPSLGALVADDKVDLVGSTALVWAKHDSVGGVVNQVDWGEGWVGSEELEVSSTA